MQTVTKQTKTKGKKWLRFRHLSWGIHPVEIRREDRKLSSAGEECLFDEPSNGL